ncbi:MAG TPA: histone deacetylase [Candidatus Acidoferrales bacterium]|nr:histone deacetylase [Candidatus Acidoferrales bacterium]
MLPFPLIYHKDYDLNLGAHVFPSQKYRMIHDRLLADGTAAPGDFLAPEPAADEDVLRVHLPDYVHKLRTGTLSREEETRLEVPYSKELIRACWLAAGGSILAGRRALADGWAANIGGGFHHACPDHGEGFCVIHDVAIAIRRLQFEGAIQRAMVVDTDVHQGNGTAAIFGGDATVFTLSIHQEHNYPHPKPPSTVDINLEDGTGDDEYLAALEKHLKQAFRDFASQLLFYVAGADPYREDQLGGLGLTMEGLAQRDALIFDYARRYATPVAIALAGGYARRVADTVSIHVGTILAARDAAALRARATRG